MHNSTIESAEYPDDIYGECANVSLLVCFALYIRCFNCVYRFVLTVDILCSPRDIVTRNDTIVDHLFYRADVSENFIAVCKVFKLFKCVGVM